jgi:hypothetical protein
MDAAPIPANEDERLRALRRLLIISRMAGVVERLLRSRSPLRDV